MALFLGLKLANNMGCNQVCCYSDSKIIIDIVTKSVNKYHSAGGGRAKCSFMQLVWLISAWIMWNDRNQRLFNNLGSSIDQLLDKVKWCSLWWLKANNVVFVFGFHLWWSSPLACLGLTYL